MKTWEETIDYIRKRPEFSDLVRDAYYEADLGLNVERFRQGAEFHETLSVIKANQPEAQLITEIGSGNGIASIALGLEGYQIYSIEPDPSLTIGAGAIRQLIEEYNLTGKVIVRERFGEHTGLETGMVDVVYIRQAMHHAHDLKQMMQECYRILKPGGLLLTVRDHVVFDQADKERFFQSHPLHKYYGGENAYTEAEYSQSMTEAGFKVEKVLKYYDSVINYFPQTASGIANLAETKKQKLLDHLKKKIGGLETIKWFQLLYLSYRKFNPLDVYNERHVPGRMYTFISKKPL